MYNTIIRKLLKSSRAISPERFPLSYAGKRAAQECDFGEIPAGHYSV